METPTQAEDASLPISLISHHMFCPRRAWIEAAGEQLTTSYAMAAGDTAHRRVHDRDESDPRTIRAMEVYSSRFGFHGTLDAAERRDGGALTIVEYKATPVRKASEVTEPMKVQLALQAIALEEMGHRVDGAAVHFTTQKRRISVDLDPDLREAAINAVEATRQVVEARSAPPPLEDDPRCAHCSHVSLCLPDERIEETTPRRISVPDPDSQVLHLATYGAYASLRAGRVRVSKSGEELSSIPIERVQAVVVHGNVDLTSGLLRELMWRRVPVLWCSSTGRLVGSASSMRSPNGQARVDQHVQSNHGRIDLAREFVTAKISNQATLLRRHGDAPEAVVGLRKLARRASVCPDTGSLFGVEGRAAAAYFAGFPTMISTSKQDFIADFHGRVGRGATDRLNVALNYVYGRLTADCVRAITACGLDAHAGFLHSSRRNNPALALDLMEEFRPVVADSVVIGAINNGEIGLSGFTDLAGSMRLGDAARKALIAAYERRVEAEFSHPVFDYRVTWRRAIEVQARMVLGVLDGSQAGYKGIRVR